MNKQNQSENSRRGSKVRHPGGSRRGGKEHRARERVGKARSSRSLGPVAVDIRPEFIARDPRELFYSQNSFGRNSVPLSNRLGRKANSASNRARSAFC